MLIFGSKPGRVSAIVDFEINAVPITITVGGSNGVPILSTQSTYKAVLTSFSMEAMALSSENNTLRENIYIWVSGANAMQPVAISGILFPGTCNSGDQTGSGYAQILQYYEQFRVSSLSLPIKIALEPHLVLVGFLKSLKMGTVDPSSGVGEFTFLFSSPPRRFISTPPGGTLGGAELVSS